MLIGYNNDVDHRGKTFHIQTEDRGSNDSSIETQLFHGGAILDTKITNYSEHIEGLEGKERNKKIKAIMKASHRSLFKKLLAGKYDEMVGLDPVEKPEEVVEEKTEQFRPGQDRVPQGAVELEQEGIESLEEEAKKEGWQDPGGAEHVGLSALKDKLKGLKAAGAGGAEKGLAEESTGASTARMDAPPKMDEDEVFTGETDRMPASAVGQFATTDTRGAASAVPVEFPATGVSAWTGCEEPGEDLSLTSLVEEALG